MVHILDVIIVPPVPVVAQKNLTRCPGSVDYYRPGKLRAMKGLNPSALESSTN
jgi:hypothetical protein